jgi:hypothetical protein
MQNSFGVPTSQTVTSTGTLIVGFFVTLVVGFILYRILTPQAREVAALGPYKLERITTETPKNTQISIFNMSAFQAQEEAWYMRVLRWLRVLGARNTGTVAMGNNFTFSGFYYMEDTNAERIGFKTTGEYNFKPTVYIVGVGDITLDPIHQKAFITIKQTNGSTTSNIKPNTTIEIDNMTVAKWNQLTLTVVGRTVDVYLNGVLAKSAQLENVPPAYPLGILLETSPDFAGQAGLFQAWPERLTVSQVARNYARNVDTRGKPLIPDAALRWWDVWSQFASQLCSVGFCGFDFAAGPLQYIDYEYA